MAIVQLLVPRLNHTDVVMVSLVAVMKGGNGNKVCQVLCEWQRLEKGTGGIEAV